ncbi:hypothetical protein Mal64_00130 [Pseudobythopirellula maris]|uniref:EF-hand domain-containing protein n=1 Tax=Pseudobythopirellula maris TaxID=2527991 RepID=A0A5C5ZQY9_9BACT|nr:hypothetical protein [Pseudobythopirellula maris]TWT89636.1 hypothetical protein Mal64_00130 [Pseudobythopirellula maris]
MQVSALKVRAVVAVLLPLTFHTAAQAITYVSDPHSPASERSTETLGPMVSPPRGMLKRPLDSQSDGQFCESEAHPTGGPLDEHAEPIETILFFGDLSADAAALRMRHEETRGATFLLGDTDRDGIVSTTDYFVWRVRREGALRSFLDHGQALGVSGLDDGRAWWSRGGLALR